MSENRWSGLGDVRELERKAKDSQKNEAATIAFMALNVVNNLKYLNGCVVRGRGEDIDTEHPARNVFEYIKELEQTITTQRQQLRQLAGAILVNCKEKHHFSMQPECDFPSCQLSRSILEAV